MLTFDYFLIQNQAWFHDYGSTLIIICYFSPIGGGSQNNLGGPGGSGFIAIRYIAANCNPGYSGSVEMGLYDCVPVLSACPNFSTGTDISTGDCKCDAGYTGSVIATTFAPYFVSSCAPAPKNQQSFFYTRENQVFTIPAGISQITAYIWGAGGGGANAEGFYLFKTNRIMYIFLP